MAVAFSTVTCSEEHGSATENWGDDGIECSVVLRVPFVNRHLLVASILDGAHSWPYGAFANPPVAVSAAIRSSLTDYIQDGQGIVYSDSLVTVGYSTSVVDLISESLEPVAEFQTLDHEKFRWGGASQTPLVEGEAPGKLLQSMNLVRTNHKVSTVPSALLSLVGYVNDPLYASPTLGLTFDVETLLYGGGTLNRTITSEGAKAWNVTTTFSYKPETWNKFYRASTGTYERIYRLKDGAAADSYSTGSFATLLT